jgi:hypothetical protein
LRAFKVLIDIIDVQRASQHRRVASLLRSEIQRDFEGICRDQAVSQVLLINTV